MNLDGLFINQGGWGGWVGGGGVRTLLCLGGLIFRGVLVPGGLMPLRTLCGRNKTSQFLYNSQNTTEKIVIFDYTFNSKWTEVCDPHFCNAHFFEILLIAQKSVFLKLAIILLTVCCSKNTTDPITINLNSLSGQALYQLCTQDSQNIWQHHFT